MMTESPLHVLVIEDDADTRSNLCDILELDAYRVETASTIQQALQQDDWARFFTVVLDRKLPDGTAEQVLPRLKQLAPQAAVLIVTGYADLDGAIAALRQGVDDYILKPINADTLRASLERLRARKLAEDTLRDREARLSSILNAAVDGIITADQHGTIESCNPAAERMFGYRAIELIGENIHKLMPDPYHSDPPQGLQHYTTAAGPGLIGVRHNVAGRRKDGTLFPIDLSVSETEIDGQPLYTGIVRDITERRRVEERATGLGRILEDSLNEIYIFDADTLHFLQVNRGARDNLGYSMEELRQLTPLDLKREFTAESFQDLLEPLRSGQREQIQFETKHWRSDGTEYDVEVHLQLSTLDWRPVFVAIILDVTEQKRAEQRALQSERLAAIGQMVAGLAHESRNAFQRSQACLEMLQLELEDRPDALDLVQRIQRAQEHLYYLYEEVRNYAAPINLNRQVCNLAHLWRETWSDLELARQKKPVELSEIGTDMNLSCRADPFALQQVFRNILENAIAACRSPGRITIRCHATQLENRPAVRVAIKDNGPGLTPEQRRNLFQPFYTTKTHGTGLGMAIARRLVEAHGGELVVGDSTSPGAELVITLPQSR